MKFKKLNTLAITPRSGTNFSAGYDLFSIEDEILSPGCRKLFKIGVALSIPVGKYGRIAPRSGLAFKKGIDVLAGVIDCDYRDELGVLLINLGQEDVTIKTGDAIAQIIFENYSEVIFEETDTLDETVRGIKGFGSTDNHQPSVSVPKHILDLHENQLSEKPRRYLDSVKERKII